MSVPHDGHFIEQLHPERQMLSHRQRRHLGEGDHGVRADQHQVRRRVEHTVQQVKFHQ